MKKKHSKRTQTPSHMVGSDSISDSMLLQIKYLDAVTFAVCIEFCHYVHNFQLSIAHFSAFFM